MPATTTSAIVRRDAYVTNAVKHIRWKPDSRGGPRRLHATPSAGQAAACRPWLAAELQTVQPELVVALGATAAKSLFGPSFRLTQRRGALISWPPTDGPFAAPTVDLAATGNTDPSADPSHALATIHPSAGVAVGRPRHGDGRSGGRSARRRRLPEVSVAASAVTEDHMASRASHALCSFTGSPRSPQTRCRTCTPPLVSRSGGHRVEFDPGCATSPADGPHCCHHGRVIREFPSDHHE